MNRRILCVSLWSFLMLLPLPAWAHHGKDFLLLESYELPHPRSLYFVASDTVFRDDGRAAWEGEPSLLWGVRERLALELHAHFEREPGESIHYEALAPAIHFQLTDPRSSATWQFAIAAEYEFGRSRDEDSLEARLIAMKHFGDAVLALNLTGAFPREGDDIAGYAAGFHSNTEARWAWGVEAQGEFERGGTHEAIGALYAQITPTITIKAGAGVLHTEEDTSGVAHLGLVVALKR